MTDSLKFGPEWLRNMSTDSSSSSATAAAANSVTNSGPRYPLSEFRYGREEMLALFDKNVKIPEILPRYKYLFVEKLQCPLALTPSAEEDQQMRMWPMRSSPGLSVRGGRGGIMDRGRGRGRGTYHSVGGGGMGGYQRSSSLLDEDGPGGRTIAGRGERWVDRNGTDPSDWSSGLQSTSPRKEYNSHGRGTSIESWRRPRAEDDPPLEQWRSGSLGPREPTKWGRSTSWREEDSTLAESRGYNNDRGYNNAALERTGGMAGGRPLNRRPWEVPEDNLPEWAVENPLESGGSFDATGAFHGSDDELSPDNSHDRPRFDKQHKGGRTDPKDTNGSNDEGEERPPRKRSDTEKDLLAHEADHGEGRLANHADQITSSTAMIAMISTTTVSSSTHAMKSSAMAEHHEQAVRGGNQSGVDRMQEVADDMVEKLIMDDELSMGGGGGGGRGENDKAGKLVEEPKMGGPGGMMGGGGNKGAGAALSDTEWYYRDPQDMVQGPFSAVEMAEWYQAGYFDNNLCVRRKNDQRFSKLGDLIDMCGGDMPFFVPYRDIQDKWVNAPPPTEPQQPLKVPPLMPHAPRMMDMEHAANIDPRILRQQYIARQQAIAYQKLSSSDMWHMLSQEQQRQMISKHVAQIPIPDSIYGLQAAIAAGDSAMQPFGLFGDMMNKPPPLDGTADSAILQQSLMAKKMQQQQQQQQQRILPPGHMPMMPPIPQEFPPVINPGDPLNHMIHNMRIGFPPVVQPNNPLQSMMGGPQGPPPPQQQPPPAGSAAENDRIKTLLMQLSMQKGMQPQQTAGGPAALPQMMMSQQQSHLQQKPGMVPWPFGGGDPMIKGGGQQPGGALNMMGSNNGGPGPNAWLGGGGLDGGAGQNGPGGMEMGRVNQTGGGIWELEHKLFNNSSAKPIEMKTEKQILEEQHLAMLHEEKMKEQEAAAAAAEEQTKLQHQIQAASDHQPKESGDNKGWTKVEAKVANNNNKVEMGNKKGADPGDKNAKKKEAPKPGANNNGKKEEPSKKPSPAEELARSKQNNLPLAAQKAKPEDQRPPASNKVANAPANNNNKSQAGGKGANTANSQAKSVAPWSINQPVEAPGLSLAEIQKLELEQQRAEQSRMDQILQQQWFDIQNLKADLPKWNAPQIAPSVVKSLAEIQAEEQAKLRQWQENAAAQAAATQPVAVPKKAVQEEPASAVWGSMKAWESNGPRVSTAGGFWEDYARPVSNNQASTAAKVVAAGGKTIAKSQTMSSIQSKPVQGNVQATSSSVAANKAVAAQKNKAAAAAASSSSASSAAATNGNAAKKEVVAAAKKGNKRDDASGQEFTQWCTKALSAYNSTIDIPTFVAFLQDIESPYEVKDYIRVYLGETKECTDFCKQFLERRSKYKNQIRAQNAHVDDMCSPAPAITPSSDFQEVKGKGKKVKKNKMMKLDSRILGFSVTAAQDRINVGDRDYPNAS